ncbi:MAG: DNA adenine methylase [Phycisphaerales bacterium]|nr:DNA adenine methylase [Phycisphaerales bacterium]
MIKYLGSKRKLLPSILEQVDAVPECCSVLDLFSGTSRVGHALKQQGYRVISNDHNAYAHTLATCYVQADRDQLLKDVQQLVEECNQITAQAGWFTETFCLQSRFIHPRNGARIDAIREHLASLSLEPELEAVMLVSLMEAADRVDSTTGVQMAYLKQWAARARKDLAMRVPDFLPQAANGKGEAHCLDAAEAASRFKVDVAYLDPPYNQHSYLGNYHVWESLVRWDKPEVYGVACKRTDCQTRKSPFNRKRQIAEAMQQVIDALQAKVAIISFSNEGYLSREDLETMLGNRGNVTVLEHDYKRYVGAQIGIHNQKGRKVGKVSHLRNTEYLFVLHDQAA